MGAITVSNISASGNYDFAIYGANLNNSTSITAAPVTLLGTNIFDSNNGYGLKVLSKGAITASSINASKNITNGSDLDNSTAASALQITLIGSSTFNSNGSEGLDLFSQGVITANNLSADGNGTYGVWLDNLQSFTSNVNVTGTNFFTNNGHEGLYIDSYGAISLNNITTNGNGTATGFGGLFAENNGALLPQNITLTGISNFNKNNLYGASLNSSGKVSIGNVTAIGNLGSAGVIIVNSFLGILKPQTVTLLGPSMLTNNNGDNLDIATYGAITLNNLTANGSVGGIGANLNFNAITSGNVTLNGVNSFNHNSSTGLNIVSNGTVLLNGLSALSNHKGGAYIDNTASTTLSPVTLNGVSTLNYNSLAALYIDTKGAIVTNGLTVVSNGSGVSLNNNIPTFTSAVTLNGLNAFTNNSGMGLTIQSFGKVITSALNATGNTSGGVNITTQGAVTTGGLTAVSNGGGGGVSIFNDTATSSQPVTLNGMNTFNKNSGTGLAIQSKGTVLVSGLTALSNSSSGASINNTVSSGASGVTLNGVSTLNYNSSTALYIDTKGAIVTNGFTVISNGSGVSLNNNIPTFTSAVTLNGLNTFTNNSGMGLTIQSFGKVITTALNATGNTSGGVNITTQGAVTTGGLTAVSNGGGGGVSIFNDTATTSQPVTLNGMNTFNKNSGTGLAIQSKGTVLVSGLTALSNSSSGVSINNTVSSGASGVTLNGVSTLNYNSSAALYIDTKGAIVTNGLTVISNGSGVSLNNNIPTFTSAVTLNGLNSFTNNFGMGLNIQSFGKVITTALNATGNTTGGVNITTKGSVTTGGLTAVSNGGGGGVSIFNDSATTSQPVTLNGLNAFNKNSGTGLTIQSAGTVLVSGLTALSNSSSGVSINNTVSSGASGVTLNGVSTLNYNSSTALYIDTKGAIVTKGLTVVSNGSGVSINNNIPTFTSAVTLNGLNSFTNNFGMGLNIQSFGKVITTALNATGNSTGGVNITTKGSVTTGGLTAVSNGGGGGVSIFNDTATTSQPVTLNGLNAFNKNSGTGLTIQSAGTVLVSGLTALSNSSSGVSIDNTVSSGASGVTLNGVSTLNYNSSAALYIDTKGAIVTNGLTVVSNGSGVSINNNIPTFTSAVTLNGLNAFTNNSGMGLNIQSYGKVITTALNATGNISGGVNITTKGSVTTGGLTAVSNGGGGGVSIFNDTATSSQPVTLNGMNTFNKNSGTGLAIQSKGTVLVSGLSALSNSSSGAVINNTSSSIASPVTLNGLTTTNYNGSTGLVLNSHGTVLTNGLMVIANGSSGAIIDNSGSTSSSPVTLKGTNTFSNNASTGLNLDFKGALLTNGLSVLSNGSNGAIIDNSGSSAVAPITLLGLSTFNFNGSTGLILTSKNTVLTNGLSVLNNGSGGAIIDNSSSTTSATVTLKGIDTFNNNSGTGLNLSSKGTVLTNGLSASNNGSDGAIIDNSPSSTVAPVTLKGINVFNNNGSTGLLISSKNAISTNNLTASDNGINGVDLQNNSLGASGAINVLGKNVVFNNGSNGINLFSNGAVTVTNISSKFNYYDGLAVDTPGNVSVTCGSFIGNGTGHVSPGYGLETGLNVTTVKLTGVTIAGNYSGDILKDAGGGTTITFIPKTCVLP